MKKVIITLISFFCAFITNSQCFVDTAKLNQSFIDLNNFPVTYEREKAFFDAFPSSWMEFVLTYQYYPNKSFELDYINHIELFKNLKLIPDSMYCDKLIFLSVGGKWEADATGALQNVLHTKMNNKTEVFFSRLARLHRGFQLRFWQFFWSSITHSEDNLKRIRNDYVNECELIKNKMGKKYPDEVKTMETAFSFALGEITFSTIENNFPHKYFVK